MLSQPHEFISNPSMASITEQDEALGDISVWPLECKEDRSCELELPDPFDCESLLSEFKDDKSDCFIVYSTRSR